MVPEIGYWFNHCLPSLIEVRSLGHNSQYLSIETCQNADGWITISQSHYISQVLSHCMTSSAEGLSALLEKNPDAICLCVNLQRKFDKILYEESVRIILYWSTNTKPRPMKL